MQRIAAFAAACSTAFGATLPNFVMVLTDDLGYNYPGWRNPDVITPALDELKQNGLEIPDMYVYKFCSPSRGAFLTGRYPWRLPQSRCNFLPSYMMDGTPLGYSMLPARLAAQGYVSYHSGKWHQGLYNDQFTPLARGFNYTDSFLSGGEDHFNQAGDLGVGNCSTVGAPLIRDAWIGNASAPQVIGNYTGTRFTDTAVNYITRHKERHGDAPMFLYLALHNTHAPLQSLPRFHDLYPNVSWGLQRQLYAMVSTVDSSVANVTQALKDTGLWDNTLFVWLTDNGSPIQVGGSNAPLRGGKGSNWDGGVKVPAFVNGGLLPDSQRGKAAVGMMHIMDFYSTFLTMAGLNASDPGGHAPIDSLDVWPWLSGQLPTSPRTELVLDHIMYNASKQGVRGAMRQGRYKLLVGPPGGEPQASWYGQFSPNATNPVANLSYAACGNNAVTPGCLFDVEADPGEHVDLASTMPGQFTAMLARFGQFNATYHPPDNNPTSDMAGLCTAALANDFIVTPWRTDVVPEGSGSPFCE